MSTNCTERTIRLINSQWVTRDMTTFLVRCEENKHIDTIRYIHMIPLGRTPLSFSAHRSFLPFHLNNVLSSSDKNTVSRRASGSLCESEPPILHLPVPAPALPPPLASPPLLLQRSRCLLLFHSSTLSLVSSSHFPSIFRSFPPTDYLQDYRFSVGCD